MSKASGLVLILAGLGVAAYVMPQGTERGEQDALWVSSISKLPGAHTTQAAVAPVAKRDEPRAGVPAPTPPTPQPAVKPVVVKSPPPVAPPTPSSQPAAAPVVVTLAQRASEPPSRAPAAPVSHAASLPGDRVSLTRELQRELKRVGCYEGEVNATWTPTTKKAMKAFTDRVNATLPVDEPDYILLSLLQAHQDKACGKGCPVGQGFAEDGRCLPTAILARAAKKVVPIGPAVAAAQPPSGNQTPTVSTWTTTTAKATPPALPSALPSALPTPPTEGRMALAGPKAEAPPAPAAPVAVRSAPRTWVPPPSVPIPLAAIYERRPPAPRVAQRPARDARIYFRQLESNAR